MKLNDIVAVSGLLLTLTTFLFNLAWPKISEALDLDESTSGERARIRCRKKISNTNWFIVFPILIAFFMLFYVNLPTAVEVMKTRTFTLWNFDVDDTLYVMVVFALLAFVIFNLALFIKLMLKQSKFK
ncbi:hypothetical protein [Vibrio splendidus]|uniref:hypothetical protein n=1 Tax=Vibrio splendidus TaxID=29497 RepID=UPI000D37FD81|nr:hypothetical protein [Vibrio splendidus]PTP43817.1 hypothetical protein CWN83_21280 [Vibrio splendidus]